MKVCQLVLPSVSLTAEALGKHGFTGVQSSHVATVNPVSLQLLTELWVLWRNSRKLCYGSALLSSAECPRKPEPCTLAALSCWRMVGSMGAAVNPGIP